VVGKVGKEMAWLSRVGGVLVRPYVRELKLPEKYKGTFIEKWGKDISTLKLSHSGFNSVHRTKERKDNSCSPHVILLVSIKGSHNTLKIHYHASLQVLRLSVVNIAPTSQVRTSLMLRN